MKDTLCIGGEHSHHQFGVNLVGFHAIIFTVYLFIFYAIFLIVVPQLEYILKTNQSSSISPLYLLL